MKVTDVDAAIEIAKQRAKSSGKTHFVVAYKTESSTRFRVFRDIPSEGVRAWKTAKIGETFYQIGKWAMPFNGWLESAPTAS